MKRKSKPEPKSSPGKREYDRKRIAEIRALEKLQIEDYLELKSIPDGNKHV